MAKKNKIVEYYKLRDERLPEYYFEYLELLGLDKQPFGLDENGTLRFETKETDSRIWKRYKELGGSETEIGDLNKLFIEFQQNKFTLEEMMQLYRETGTSLSYMVDCFSERFYAVKDKKEFQAALDKLKGVDNLDKVKEDILDTLFLAHMDSVQDELILEYRREAKKIVDENFGTGTWKEFVVSIRNKKNEK